MMLMEGTMVLDLARRYPAAYPSTFLADFGADVIKVDPPSAAQLSRAEGMSEERFAAFNATDRNKRSLILDLKKEEGREAFRRLAKRADVLIEGFRPGVMGKLGLGYPQLSELNPRLIYCSLSGFGQDGPYAAIPAHDMNYISIAGALSLVGERNGRPYIPSNIIADFGGAAMHATVGVLLALLARQKTGKGQFVDISYVDSTMSLIVSSLTSYFSTGVVPQRGETKTTGGAPFAQVFRCKDGKYFTIQASEQHLWANLCRALGREDLIAEHSPTTLQRTDQIVAELAAIFCTRTRDEWFEYLRDKEACVGPVYTIDETVKDPQVLHREMVVEIQHPTVGPVKQMGVPIKLSETPGTIRSLGVPTGANSEAVLAELGYSDEQIAAMRAKGILG